MMEGGERNGKTVRECIEGYSVGDAKKKGQEQGRERVKGAVARNYGKGKLKEGRVRGNDEVDQSRTQGHSV